METAAPAKFQPGTKVRILNPVIVGTVVEVAEKPAPSGEYWHTIETKYGVLKHLGPCLERLP
jgi:hypothetical protein